MIFMVLACYLLTGFSISRISVFEAETELGFKQTLNKPALSSHYLDFQVFQPLLLLTSVSEPVLFILQCQHYQRPLL